MKDMSGSIRRNDKKTEDRHPDIKGSAMIDGQEFWISGWKKDGDSGPWYSLAFTAKEAKAAQKPAKQTAGGVDTMDDDLPF